MRSETLPQRGHDPPHEWPMECRRGPGWAHTQRRAVTAPRRAHAGGRTRETAAAKNVLTTGYALATEGPLTLTRRLTAADPSLPLTPRRRESGQVLVFPSPKSSERRFLVFPAPHVNHSVESSSPSPTVSG
jgi:hypothetical protein